MSGVRGLNAKNISVDEQGHTSQNTFDMNQDPKYREALEWSKKSSERRRGGIRSQNPDLEEAFEAGKSAKRLLCPSCGISCDLTAVLESPDRDCICGEKLLRVDGKPCAGVEIIQ